MLFPKGAIRSAPLLAKQPTHIGGGDGGGGSGDGGGDEGDGGEHSSRFGKPPPDSVILSYE